MSKRMIVNLLCLLLLCTLCMPAMAEEAPLAFSVLNKIESTFVPEGNPVVEAIDEACNVKITYICPPINSYGERLNILLTSGEYPEVIYFDTAAAFNSAMENDLLLPLDEYLEKYENLKQYLDPSSISMLRALGGGQLYALPQNTVARTDGMAIRLDWCEKLGIEIPEDGYVTKEQLYDIMYAFTFGDPDGDGINNTYGYTWQKGLTPMWIYAFGCMEWQEHDGEQPYMNEMYCTEHSNYKDALAYTAKLWQDGLLDPDIPNNSGNAYRDRFYNGRTGMAYMFGGWAQMYEDGLKAINPDAELGYIVGVYNDEGKVEAASTFGSNLNAYTGLSISAADNADRIMGVMDFLLSDEGWGLVCDGVEGDMYTVGDDGVKVATDAYTDYTVYRNSFAQLRRYTDPTFFVPLNGTPEARATAMEYIGKAVAITIPDMGLGYVPEVTRQANYQDYISELEIARAKIIVGDMEVDAWDGVLAQWYQNGGTEYVREMNAFIESTR